MVYLIVDTIHKYSLIKEVFLLYVMTYNYLCKLAYNNKIDRTPSLFMCIILSIIGNF